MRNTRYLSLLLLLFAGSCLLVSAQSNELVDKILDQEELTAETAAYLALAGAGHLDPDATLDDAFTYARERRWILETYSGNDPVRLGDFAELIVRSFEIPGGLMYRLAPGPRYAARELAFREIVVGSVTPYRDLSGEEALRILGEALDWREDRS
jgi:hypothetical protein